MNLSETCVRRPVLAWVLTLVLIMLGLVTGSNLSFRQNPKEQKNNINIEKKLPGAGPEIIEAQITRYIEEAIAGTEGIESVESKSEYGTSKVDIEVTPGKDLESVTNDIRDKLGKWADKFPHDAQEAIITKAGSNDKPVITLVMESNELSETDLYNLASNEVAHAFEGIPGVAKVESFGSGDCATMIEVDHRMMAKYGLVAGDVIKAVRSQNIEVPGGEIIDSDREFVITTVTDAQSPEEFENIPIVTKNKGIVKLRDIATVKLDTNGKKVASRFNGKKAVVLYVIARSSANPIQVARGVKERVKEVRYQIPDDVKCTVAYDSTTFIERSLDEVIRTIFESIVFVVLVVFVFLRSLRASTIPLITVPISLIGSLFIMYLCDFTLNNMTLMSMVLAIGLVVDDAIVILENVYKHIEMGKSAIKAAIEGTKEVSFAVIAMTLTLCAVYAPVALAQGQTGRFLREFSVTLAGSVFLSGFIALTLSPMMCSRVLATKGNEKILNKYTEWWYKLKDRFDSSSLLLSVENKYEQLVKSVLGKRKMVIFISILFSAFGYVIYFFLPSEYMPYQDKGMFRFDGHAPYTSTLQYTQRYVDAIDKVIGEVDDIEERFFNITNPTFEGGGTVKPRNERSTDEILAEIKDKMKLIAGVDVRFTSGSGGGDDGARTVSFVIKGNKSHRELRDISKNLINDLFGIFQSILASSKDEAKTYTIEVMRDKASSVGIDPFSVAEVVDVLMRGRLAGHFKRDNKQFDVIVKVQDDYRKNIEQINELCVRGVYNNEEILIPLAELVNIHIGAGPVSIYRYNRTRAHTVMGILGPSHSVGEAIKIVRDLAKKNLPGDVFIEFVGETKRYLNESNTMFLIFILAISFIYLVMAAQFESWRDPFIIMLTVPLALVGGVLTLACIKNGSINMFSNMGFLTLIGLITKHGILIVDFANKLVDKGKSIHDAIVEASRMRLRPILMTTFAMILGSLPLAIAKGAGCEVRIPLGSVIVGGMAIGTVFTLFVLPVFYTYVAAMGRKRKRRGNNNDSSTSDESIVGV